MNNPFDFFEEIWCINLDHRIDRWENAQKEFNSVGILDKVQRFSAIKHDDGRIGVIKSNLELIKMAKIKKLKNILIFEDDIKFLMYNEPLKNLQLAIESVQQKKLKWDMFYLGANTHNKLTKLSQSLIYLRDAFALHSAAYSEQTYNKFINYAENVNEIKNMKQILDIWVANEIQNKGICLMVNPIITTQMASYSDIERKNVNYSFIEERFKNNIL